MLQRCPKIVEDAVISEISGNLRSVVIHTNYIEAHLCRKRAVVTTRSFSLESFSVKQEGIS